MSRFPSPSLAVVALLSSLFIGSFALPDLLPEAEASSRNKRTIRKLKKQGRGLRRTANSLRAELTATRAQLPKPATIEMVTVGNVGNAADPEDGDNINPGVQNFGAVNYEFSIGKYEVSLVQYARFLNAVAATNDPHQLYNGLMATDLRIAGIERSGSFGNYTYSVIGSGDRPVTYVTWFDAARFCNWLHNKCPIGVQDASTTERGAYTLDGAINGGLDITRNPGAKYWIPSENEWYKAAFHDPRLEAEGGPPGDDFYWLYSTMSDTVPENDIGPLPLANQANYIDGGGYSVTQSLIEDPNQNYLTDGGSYEGSAGPYGTFDQGGNVWEWNDAVISVSERGLRGSSWFTTDEFNLRSSLRNFSEPGVGSETIGFRVASP